MSAVIRFIGRTESRATALPTVDRFIWRTSEDRGRSFGRKWARLDRNRLARDSRAGLGYAGPVSFSGEDLAAIDAAEEVRIETQAPGGDAHRTIIWIMVDDGEVFVRSVDGERGRWYQEAKANPAVAIHLDGRRLPATAIPADDPDSIERVSAALNRKYAGHGGSLRSMLQPHNFATTLRLEPA